MDPGNTEGDLDAPAHVIEAHPAEAGPKDSVGEILQEIRRSAWACR
jgi:hypothetical protein